MPEERKPSFASDYMEGAHPLILERLARTNLEKTAGYGLDEYSESARSRIREACGTPERETPEGQKNISGEDEQGDGGHGCEDEYRRSRRGREAERAS